MLKNNLYDKAYLNIINESSSTLDPNSDSDPNYQHDLVCYRLADMIGGEYLEDINTIDCKGNIIRIHNGYLKDGTFDFKIINFSDDFSKMFYGCSQLTHLPDDFTIPTGVTKCQSMFAGCCSLVSLPEHFSIPEGVVDCHRMFDECRQLKTVPTSFTLPQSVRDCSCMFDQCYSLNNLPNGFVLPEQLILCYSMFSGCKSLTDLPDGFTIPSAVQDCDYMFSFCKSLTHLPNNFKIPLITGNTKDTIFRGCVNLEINDPEYYSTWDI